MDNEKNDRQGLLPNVIIRLDDITLKECKKACLELAGSRKECLAIEWNMYQKACVLFDSTKSFASPSSGSVFSTKSCEITEFVFHSEKVDYAGAKAACAAAHTFLVRPKDQQVMNRLQNFLKDKTITDYHVWIGLDDIDIEGTFKWNDGDVLTWSKWSGDNPDNYRNMEDCATVVPLYNYRWNDARCGHKYEFVCQLKETRPRPPMPGGCSGTLWGCCNDGETSARGPNQLGCPEDPIFS